MRWYGIGSVCADWNSRVHEESFQAFVFLRRPNGAGILLTQFRHRVRRNEIGLGKTNHVTEDLWSKKQSHDELKKPCNTCSHFSATTSPVRCSVLLVIVCRTFAKREYCEVDDPLLITHFYYFLGQLQYFLAASWMSGVKSLVFLKSYFFYFSIITC